MAEAMVTARMDDSKKARGAQILKLNNMNASQAVNRMYDRLIEEQDISFLESKPVASSGSAFQNARDFVDNLSLSFAVDFPDMTRRELRAQRLAERGLM